MNKNIGIKEARQRQLIEATITSIGRRGYANTTLTHVAGEAGMSPGIVNFYFKSKDQLLAATLAQLVEEYETCWRATLAAAGDSPALAVDAIIEADFHPSVFTLEKVAVWYAFWAEAQSQPSYREVVSQLEARYFEETRQLCQRLIDDGGYHGLDAGAVASGLNAMIDGLWFDLLIDPREFDREGAMRICRLFLGGLFPREFSNLAAPASGAAVCPAQALSSFRVDHEASPALLVEEPAFGRAAHRGRIASALRRRLAPQTMLTRTALAEAIGIDAQELATWLDESGEPSSWELGQLLVALDAQFWVEIYGPVGELMRRRLEARSAASREAEARERKALNALMHRTN